MTHTSGLLSRDTLIERLDELSEHLRRRRATARIYIIGGAAMALAYGQGRTTDDVDARIDAGHSALIEAARAIARKHHLPTNWLNEQATSAIPRPPDRNARTLYESAHLVVTGASARYLLAMKLEAGRDKDVNDIVFLLQQLGIDTCDQALAVHEELLPDSERRPRARALLSALAAQTEGLAHPISATHTEHRWLATLASDRFPRYECEPDDTGWTLIRQSAPDTPRETLGHGLTLRGLALIECDHRGWPPEAVPVIEGFTAAEMARPQAIGRNRTGR